MSQVHHGQSTQFVISLEARKRLESVRPCTHSLTCRPQGQPEDLLDASHTTSTRHLPLSLSGRVGALLVFDSCAARLSLRSRLGKAVPRDLSAVATPLCFLLPHLVSPLLGLGPPLVRSCFPARWLLLSPLCSGLPPPLSLSPSLLGCCLPPLRACVLVIPACHRLSTGLAHCRP